MNLWEKDQAGVGHKDLKQPSLRLIWGNGSFSHTGNHLPPVANIGLFRKLAPFFDEAILQDEPNTSKKSSCCHEDVVWFEKKSKKAGYCPRCKTPWNRDLGAARNILQLFHYQRLNEGRLPPWAQRNPPSPPKTTTKSKLDGACLVSDTLI
mmetsp:Transcript_42972/g.60265  ORF Transcript_42972/g.60265 Transcript_42972/m.60265 type:complete len:151 (+) Transcript_42972:601-1053(+)